MKVLVISITFIVLGAALYMLPSLFLDGERNVQAEGLGGAIYVSQDYGNSFEPGKVIDSETLPEMNKIVFVKSGTSTLFLAGTDRGLYASKNALEWRPLSISNKKVSLDGWVYDIVVDSADSNHLFVSLSRDSRAYIYETKDLFQSVEEIYYSQENIAAQVMLLDGGALMLGMSNGEVLSYNIDRQTFRGLNKVPSGIIELATKDNGVMYAATAEEGLFISYDAREWESVGRGLLQSLQGGMFINEIAGRTAFSGSVYLATGYGLLHSDDYGASWNVLTTVVPRTGEIEGVGVDESGTIYATKDETLYISDDGGLTWSLVPIARTDTGREMGLVETFDGGRLVILGTQIRRERKSGGRGLFNIPSPFRMNNKDSG